MTRCTNVFLELELKWNSDEDNYGMQADVANEYSAEDIAEDLKDLLNTLASYLPHSYLTDKILKTSTCWKDVWTIIYDHYNVHVNSES